MRSILPAAALVGLTALASFVLAAPGEPAHPRVSAVEETQRSGPTIAGLVASNDSFRTLAAALEAADLTDVLDGDGPFTVFAPTDDAFAALPDGTVDALLAEPGRATLRRVLTYHVVAAEIEASDLLPVAEAQTLTGDAVPIGLRVGRANVTRTDLRCANGIVHVIDAVLLPPTETTGDAAVTQPIESAIDRGVPLFNSGDTQGCARIYRETAKSLLAGDDLRELHAHLLEQALRMPTEDAADEAWKLREVFDRVLADVAFEPVKEADLPEGFPRAGEVGRVVVKEYPEYRAARADGRAAFGRLFQHIQKHSIPMTAPVEMTLDDDLRMQDMAFLYERPTQGGAGPDELVEVLDLEPVRVLSICIRGPRTTDEVRRAERLLRTALHDRNLTPAGPLRTLGYSSPMVPTSRRYWELQIPIAE